ncbi:hypothetical protein JNUCC0626_45335 [Lentzea sp. JNUCC 0626]|uniref:hypothetical protein n=1 Tax=Lentzea sp. JNUCC 0626 TaxID=3367513 RepID=UPI003747EC0F
MESFTKNPWFLLGGGVVAALALVAAITGPLPDLTEDKTSVTSLIAEPTGSPMSDWALPFDVPLDLMPRSASGYCEPETIEWLRRNGTEATPYHGISVRSAAEGGAMLSISNLRAVDVERLDPKPVIHFQCPSAGNAETAVLGLRLDRDRKAVELVDGSVDDTRPFAFNLEPGETGNLELRLDNEDGYSYTGRIVADVTVGKDKKTVSLPLSGDHAEKFDWVSPGKYARLIVQPGRTKDIQFTCEIYAPGFSRWRPVATSEFTDVFDCSHDRVRALLTEIGGSS